LHDVWSSPGLVHYIYIFEGSCRLTEFCQVQNSLCFKVLQIHFASKSCVLLYWQRYCTTLEQWASAKFCGVVQEMELWNFCSLSCTTEGATCILMAAITLGLGPHSSWATVCYRPVVCLSCLFVCDADVLWPNGWMD